MKVKTPGEVHIIINGHIEFHFCLTEGPFDWGKIFLELNCEALSLENQIERRTIFQ